MKNPSTPIGPGTPPCTGAPDTGQSGNTIRPPSIGLDSPRRLDIDPKSPHAALLSVTALSTATQLVELDAVANIFLAEAIQRLRYVDDEGSSGNYRHATFTDTVARFLEAQAAEEGIPYIPRVDATDSHGSEEPNSSGSPVESDSQDAPRLPLPIFPRFRLEQSFYGWVHALAESEDVAELATVLGSTIGHTYTKITNATMLAHGLPRFQQRCLAGEFTIEHVIAATRICRDLHFEHFPAMDEYLATRRADITVETFKKSLGMKTATLTPPDDRLEEASKRRRVDIATYPDGTASLTLSGPAPELKAYYLRLEAFARAIRAGDISAFTDELDADVEMIEDRRIDALMFDISTRTRPQLSIQVTVKDSATGTTTTTEIPIGVPEEKSTSAIGVTAAIHSAADRARAENEADGESAHKELTMDVSLEMPTHGQWFENQARMITTVPVLSLISDAELPGVFSDGSPIPAETARRIAGHCSTWTRILTDPATGTPIDAKATTYRIPTSLRLPLIAKWQSCTVPGCTRRAETSEVDHLIPFDHDHPARGGLTTFLNLHPLCKPHHMRKTEKKFAVRKTTEGSVEYVFSHGLVTDVAPPDHPINAEHARAMKRLGQEGDPPGPVTPDTRKQSSQSVAKSPPKAPKPPKTQEPPKAQHTPKATKPEKKRCPRKEKKSLKSMKGSKEQIAGEDRKAHRHNVSAVKWDSGDPPPF